MAPDFMKLANTYQEMVVTLVGLPCKNCLKIPLHSPAVCLVCASIICVSSECCRFLTRYGEAWYHSQMCGSGLFLLLDSSTMLLVRRDRRNVLPSLFLDEFGEEDPLLRRCVCVCVSKR
jgi:E3 ubiquitin-protein ligase UBR3